MNTKISTSEPSLVKPLRFFKSEFLEKASGREGSKKKKKKTIFKRKIKFDEVKENTVLSNAIN